MTSSGDNSARCTHVGLAHSSAQLEVGELERDGGNCVRAAGAGHRSRKIINCDESIAICRVVTRGTCGADRCRSCPDGRSDDDGRPVVSRIGCGDDTSDGLAAGGVAGSGDFSDVGEKDVSGLIVAGDVDQAALDDVGRQIHRTGQRARQKGIREVDDGGVADGGDAQDESGEEDANLFHVYSFAFVSNNPTDSRASATSIGRFAY